MEKNTETKINGYDLTEIAIQHIDAVSLTGTRTKVYLHVVQPFIDALQQDTKHDLFISVYDAHQPRIDVMATRETLDKYGCDNVYKSLKYGKDNNLLKRGMVQAFTLIDTEV